MDTRFLPVVLGLGAASLAVYGCGSDGVSTSGARSGKSGSSGSTSDESGASGRATSGTSGAATSGNTGRAATGTSGGKSGAADSAVVEVGSTAERIDLVLQSAPDVAVDVPYIFGSNAYGINGGAYFARSPMGNSAVVLDKTQEGKICISGTIDMVPTPADGSHPPYSDYWGVALGFNLNQGIPEADAAAADASSKSSPWMPAEVIGFEFTVEGAALSPIRFKSTPTGMDAAMEEDSCKITSPKSGVPQKVLFSEMVMQCWNGAGVKMDISKGLMDISFQIAADIKAPIDFDWCLTDIRPIVK